MKTFTFALLIAAIIGTASAGTLRAKERELLSNHLAARVRNRNKASAFSSSMSSKAYAFWDQMQELERKKKLRLIAEQEERKRNAAIVARKIEENRRKMQLAKCSNFKCPPGHRITSISATADGCEGTCERVTFDCASDVKQCPGSTLANPIYVSRNPSRLGCDFDPCPLIKLPATPSPTTPYACQPDLKACPGAVIGVGRDPENFCEFKECPTRLAFFTKVGDGFCRSRTNWKGRAGFVPGNGQDYKAFSGITLDECSEICELQTPTSSAGEQGYVCKGLGYFDKTKSCEIWYTTPAKSVLPPKHGQDEHGAVCYRVEHAK